LSDAIAGMNLVGLAAEVEKDDRYLTPVAGIDCSRGIRTSNAVLQRETAARANLRFESRRQLDRKSGGHQAGDAGVENYAFNRTQVHAGILIRAMRVRRQNGCRMRPLDADFHDTDFVMIAS